MDPKVLVDDPPLMAEIESLFSRTKQIVDEKVRAISVCIPFCPSCAICLCISVSTAVTVINFFCRKGRYVLFSTVSTQKK